MPFTVRRLTYDDKHLSARLRQDTAPSPESLQDDVWRQMTDEKREALLRQCDEKAGQLLLGAFAAEADEQFRLVGVVGLRRELRPTVRHKASLWGLSVVPTWRRRQVGTRLVQALLHEAEQMPDLEMLRAVVRTQNSPATTLLHQMGFQTYATEPQARFIAGAYHDESLLYRFITTGTEGTA